MISRSFIPDENKYQFTLRPNNSLSWRGMRNVILIVAATLSTISIGFSLLGLWLIFPFAGLEIIALGTGFYLCANRAQYREIITIDQDDIKILRGRKKLEEIWKFHRYWTKIRVNLPAHEWYMSRLMIGSHGNEVEIGSFLTEDERQRLAYELRKYCRSSIAESIKIT
ncbi:DUF2244 domain-containing protein [Candidatus Nitrosacidococcus tergens]|uniref:Integral membrane protein n=1 Tax=Candidatus Nitrosacidococcus tergens TaxID=553981 RepID=A0A7G1QCT7_9GAMM|nr:DUF2244 domain-containing protein [Candidatus Nitrosacidococcus tergens]CAB1277548.1 conserved protein of unknown function [Candidatus Nitrosacidococcus tergens]